MCIADKVPGGACHDEPSPVGLTGMLSGEDAAEGRFVEVRRSGRVCCRCMVRLPDSPRARHPRAPAKRRCVCRKELSVKTGTLMDRSKLGLQDREPAR